MSNWKLTSDKWEKANEEGIFYVVTQEYHEDDNKEKGKVGKKISPVALRTKKDEKVPVFYSNEKRKDMVWDIAMRLVGETGDIKKQKKEFLKTLSKSERLNFMSESENKPVISFDKLNEKNVKEAISQLLQLRESQMAQPEEYKFGVGQLLLMGLPGAFSSNYVEVEYDPTYVKRVPIKKTVWERVRIAAEKSSEGYQTKAGKKYKKDKKVFSGSNISAEKSESAEDITKSLKRFDPSKLEDKGEIRVNLRVPGYHDPNKTYRLPLYASKWSQVQKFLELDNEMEQELADQLTESRREFKRDLEEIGGVAKKSTKKRKSERKEKKGKRNLKKNK